MHQTPCLLITYGKILNAVCDVLSGRAVGPMCILGNGPARWHHNKKPAAFGQPAVAIYSFISLRSALKIYSFLKSGRASLCRSSPYRLRTNIPRCEAVQIHLWTHSPPAFNNRLPTACQMLAWSYNWFPTDLKPILNWFTTVSRRWFSGSFTIVKAANSPPEALFIIRGFKSLCRYFYCSSTSLTCRFLQIPPLYHR